jgi:hypothetical protein
MKRLTKHATPSTFIALLALIFALTGGAFAATGGTGNGGGKGNKDNTQTLTATAAKAKKKAAPKPVRGPAGPKGATGATGPAGPAGATGPGGAAGPAGPQGPQGNAGANGVNGEPGAPGVSVGSKEFTGAKGPTCKEGGTEFTSGSTGSTKTYACAGKEGSPWTDGGTLPAGKTEKGEWSTIYTATAAAQPMSSAISFTIPLKEAPAETHFIKSGETPPTGCSGSPEAPEAAPGNLCVFTEGELNFEEYEIEGHIPTHFLLFTTASGSSVGVRSIAAGEVLGFGTWAVTEADAG